MSTQPNRLVFENLAQGSGSVWYRLQSEREDICNAMLQLPAISQPTVGSPGQARNAAAWRRELLQSRLRKLDDALDRLLNGSYGNCRKCGKWIEDTKLDFDPAIAFCLACWARMQSH